MDGFSVNGTNDAYITDEMRQILKDCNINILDDKSVLINDEIYLIGRKDKQKVGDGTAKRMQISELNKAIYDEILNSEE